MLNYIFLFLGFLFTFFIVGFCFIETFFSKVIFRIKFPLYFLTSVFVSTFIIYLFSLVFGLSRITVLIFFLIIMPLFIYLLPRRYCDFSTYIKNHFLGILLSFFIVLIYLVFLYPAIFNLHNGYFVMAGSNWQDTPMHMSIVESLTQGNFPPQAPYFSSAPLNYYYFVDLHSAILSLFSNIFSSKIFVYTNSIFAGILCLSVYTFAYELTNRRDVSRASAFLATFFSNYYFFEFFKNIFYGGKIIDLLSNKSYSMEYNQIFGMANMADYYLQNRPMMVGIPAFVLATTLAIYGYRKSAWKPFFLAGIIVGMLIKFQFFSIISCSLMFVLLSFFSLKKKNYILIFKNLLIFFAPVILFYTLFIFKNVNSLSFMELVKNNFYFEPWDNKKPAIWHIYFLILNLGLPFLISMFSLFFLRKKKYLFSVVLALIFIIIPYLFRFTIAGGDMLKFFYFAAIIFSITSIYFIKIIIKNKIISKLIVILIVISSTFSSFLTLANSFLNKNYAYSVADYESGIWIRGNTPQKSIFVTMPTVHSAPTDIGGRLRIISYINWPYSHGFNKGTDNVYSRVVDVTSVYRTGDINLTKLKYGAKYIFYGAEEKEQFPAAEGLFDNNKSLKLAYNQDGIRIYEIF